MVWVMSRWHGIITPVVQKHRSSHLHADETLVMNLCVLHEPPVRIGKTRDASQLMRDAEHHHDGVFCLSEAWR